MREVFSNKQTGLITITQSWDPTLGTSSGDYPPQFNRIGDEYTISLIRLQGINSLSTFTFSTTGELDTRFLITQYRLSLHGRVWTDFMELDTNITNTPQLDPNSELWIDIQWIRTGSSTTGTMQLLSYELDGTIGQDSIDGQSAFQLGPGANQIITPPFIYKVFHIDNIEVLGTGMTSSLAIQYRFSQDNSRTWSQWEPFTYDNITTVRINPIRFFQIQYSVTNTGSSPVTIYDINMVGDFQNVTEGASSTKLYGIRCGCQSNIISTDPTSGTNGMLSGAGCSNPFTPLTPDQIAKLYDPYQQASTVNLYNQLSNDAQQLTGLKVQYFVTDPDKNGIDYSLHEYQLYNIACYGDLKVSIPDNNFPDNQITMNQFDLNLFETLEAHITKDQFKTIFGEERRPAKMDFLYLCSISRMFLVEHAQQFRGFNNASVYYKLILKKWNNSANVKAGTQAIEDKLAQLADNTTIDELFGVENDKDKLTTANQNQFKTLTQDPIRLVYNTKLNKELIENSTTIISKSNYELSTVDFGAPAVVYKNLNNPTNTTLNTYKLSDSSNLSFNCWFSINNYVEGDVFNFYTNYDSVNQIGMKINLINDNIYLKLNSDTYTFSFTGATNSVTAIQESTWYGLIINIDQRQRTLSQYLYKRNSTIEAYSGRLNSTVLQLVYSNVQSMGLYLYELSGVDPMILGSDMKMTNIRLFNDVIDPSYQSKILNMYQVGTDNQNIIFSDNCNATIRLPNFPYN